MEQILNNERTNSMNQEIIKETLDSEGNQTRFGKIASRVESTGTTFHSILTGVAALDDEDFGVNNYVSVSGTNKDGDIRITSRQSFAVRNGEEITDVFSSTQNLVISREDAKSLIQQLASHL